MSLPTHKEMVDAITTLIPHADHEGLTCGGQAAIDHAEALVERYERATR
jgi:hypothetical protein